MKLFAPVLLVCLVLVGCATGQPDFDPASTLFLTWTDDPCTTMTVQWLEAGELPNAVAGSAQPGDLAFQVPWVDGVTVDGDERDWGVRGSRLDYLGAPDGGWPDPTGFAATAKLGWTDDALLVLVKVKDDEATEADDGSLWEADGVELFVADRWGGDASVQVIVTPGLDPEHRELRTQVFDRRGFDRAPPVEVAAASRKTADGYVLEIAVPWAGIVDAASGVTPAVQVIVNDVDGPFDREQLAWFPGVDTHANLMQTQRIVLGEKADDPVRAMLTTRRATEEDAEHDGVKPGSVVLDLGGEPRLIGETVVVRSGKHRLAKVELDRTLGFAGKVIELPTPPGGKGGAAQRWPAVTVELDDRVIARAVLGDAVWRVSGEPREAIAIGGLMMDDAAHEAVSDVRPFGDSGLFMHRLTFRGLTPAGYYEVLIDGIADAFGFLTAPDRLLAPLVFAEGGDIGTEAKYVAPLHRHAASWKPWFGLVGGDLAYANGTSTKAWIEYLQLWNMHMRVGADVEEMGYPKQSDRLIPMVVTIGNHEVRGGFNKRRDAAPLYYALFDGLFVKRNYAALDFGAAGGEQAQKVPPYLSLLLLDSGHTSRVRGWQTEWLAEQLEARRGVPHLFAVYHVPAYPSHRAMDDGPRGPVRRAMQVNWVPLFQEHGVDIAFEHDDHTYKRTLLRDGEVVAPGTPGSVLYLGDGAWGMGGRDAKTRDYLQVSEAQRHVIRVEIRPDGARRFTTVNVAGEVVDEGTHDVP